MLSQKIVNEITKAQMYARIAKKKEKGKQKQAALEGKLAENTDEMNKL